MDPLPTPPAASATGTLPPPPADAPRGEAAPPPPPAPVDRDARNLAVVAHLSAFIGFTAIPAFVGPLVIWLLKRDDDPFVAEHAREALNFNLSMLLYFVALVALTIVTFGLGVVVLVPLLLVGAPAWLIATILGAVRAGDGERFSYPLSIPFVR